MKYLRLLFNLFFPVLVYSHVNLEEAFDQGIVLETKRIFIKEYPFAFNPGMIPWKGEILLTFRNIPDPKSSFTSNIGIIRLNKEFEIIGKPQILQTRNPYSKVPPRADEARLFIIGDKLYITYSDNPESKISRGGFRVYLAELVEEGSLFKLKNIQRLEQFEGTSKDVREKNWAPFAFAGELFLTYSIKPHKIFRPLYGTNICETIDTTYPSITWPWGILRGSTPALLDGDEYLSFFHSSIDMISDNSKGKKILHYFVGAYTFNSKPPFHITKVSAKPFSGINFYSGDEYKHYWKPLLVVFPCGFFIDGNYIWMSYGRQDHEMWIAKIDKEKLYQSLVPIESYSK